MTDNNDVHAAQGSVTNDEGAVDNAASNAADTTASKKVITATRSVDGEDAPGAIDGERVLYLQSLHYVEVSADGDNGDKAGDWLLSCPHVGSDSLDATQRTCGISAPCEVCAQHPEYVEDISFNTFDRSMWFMVHGVPHVFYGEGDDAVLYALVVDECGLHFSLSQGGTAWLDALVAQRGGGKYLVDVAVRHDETAVGGVVYEGVDAIGIVEDVPPVAQTSINTDTGEKGK